VRPAPISAVRFPWRAFSVFCAIRDDAPMDRLSTKRPTIFGNNYDCAERDKRRKCEADAHKTIERLEKQARETGECEANQNVPINPVPY